MKWLLILAILASTGCRFKDYKSSGNSDGGNGSATELPKDQPVTFTQVQQLVLEPKCVRCHGPFDVVDLSSYDVVVTNVKPGNPTESLLFKVVASGSMPRNSPPLSNQEKEIIFRWITDGAAR